MASVVHVSLAGKDIAICSGRGSNLRFSIYSDEILVTQLLDQQKRIMIFRDTFFPLLLRHSVNHVKKCG